MKPLQIIRRRGLNPGAGRNDYLGKGRSETYELEIPARGCEYVDSGMYHRAGGLSSACGPEDTATGWVARAVITGWLRVCCPEMR